MPRTPSRVSVRAVHPLLEGMRALGLDPTPWLEASELDELPTAGPDRRVAMQSVHRFIEAAARATGDTHLGLHLGEQIDLRAFGVHFYAMRASATLGDAFDCLCRYQRLVHDTSIVEILRAGDQVAVRHRMAGGGVAPRHVAEFLLVSWLRGGRAAVGQNWSPSGVSFAHRPTASLDEYERILGIVPRFGASDTALFVPADLLSLPCAGADERLLALLDRQAQADLRHVPGRDTWAERVRSVLVQRLTSGPSVAGAARDLHVSVRTLTRALADEGTTYRRVLDQLRRETAEHMLLEASLSVGEVAFVLGFSDPSAFSRACRRWTGRSAGALRSPGRQTPP